MKKASCKLNGMKTSHENWIVSLIFKLTDVTQENQKSITYEARNDYKLLIVRSRCVTSVKLIYMRLLSLLNRAIALKF